MSTRIVAIREDGAELDITESVTAAYDVATQSMDFGSGFLDTQEVSHLRLLGKVLGATPIEYQRDKCDRCGHDRDEHETYGEKPGCYYGYYVSTRTPARMCGCPSFFDLDAEESE